MEQGLLEREADPADRRRTLVWLTQAGHDTLRQDREVETGRYCSYCTDASGQLQSFNERFQRMVAWQSRRTPDVPRDEIERQTLDYMATMPAWREHPRVAAREG